MHCNMRFTPKTPHTLHNSELTPTVILCCIAAALASRTTAALAFGRLTALLLHFFVHLRPILSLVRGQTRYGRANPTFYY